MSINNYDLDPKKVSDITNMAVSILNSNKYKGKHSSDSNSPLDNRTNEVISELVPENVNRPFLFESSYWLALLAATQEATRQEFSNIYNNRLHKNPAHKYRYATLTQKNKVLLNFINGGSMSDKFGYETVHHSRAYYYSGKLVAGHKNIGSKVLGEVIASLDGTSETNSPMLEVSQSINILNVLLEQFSITNSFNAINSSSSLLELVESDPSFKSINKLNFEKEFPAGLEREIRNLIQQIHDEHPFTKDGMALYLKPLLAKRNPSSLTTGNRPQFPSTTQQTSREIKDYHYELEVGGKKKPGTFLASDVIEKFVTTIVPQISKANLKNKLIPAYLAVDTNGFSRITLKDFRSQANNAALIDRIDNGANLDMCLVRKLFVALDKYLTLVLLPKKYIVYPKSPLQKLRETIDAYDKTSQDASFDPQKFSLQLQSSLTEDSDKIIDYFNNWKSQFANLTDTPTSAMVHETINKLRPIVDQLSNVTDHQEDWEKIIRE
ncbi:hypothetical protein [Levilactobacillus brevis]|uniref:hypothetical protein n=1 Tax=Levilactobacillus brevis TaxID=1580 RepID=UPI001BDF4DE9|nr:hypothetical protein [Levilactobacillus brevis]